MKKTCSKCNVEKDYCGFSKDKRKLDGLQIYCKICKAEYDRNYYHRVPKRKKNKSEESKLRRYKIREWIREIKRGKKCNCGEDHPACLDFHHINDKEFSIGNAISLSYGKNRILKEIEKCIIMCSNCHRKLHWIV
jgi:hypothetical protein